MFDLSDLDDDKAIVMAGELLDELAAARSAVELYERRVIGVRKMIDGLVEMFPAVEDVLPEDYDGDDEARPRGAEAAYGVMSDAPGTWLTVGNIVSRLEQRAWLPDSSNPANAVRTALERLMRETQAIPDKMPLDEGIKAELPDLKIR